MHWIQRYEIGGMDQKATNAHNVNLMYYEGITDTPFLFQWLFPDSEQAKNFVSN